MLRPLTIFNHRRQHRSEQRVVLGSSSTSGLPAARLIPRDLQVSVGETEGFFTPRATGVVEMTRYQRTKGD